MNTGVTGGFGMKVEGSPCSIENGYIIGNGTWRVYIEVMSHGELPFRVKFNASAKTPIRFSQDGSHDESEEADDLLACFKHRQDAELMVLMLAREKMIERDTTTKYSPKYEKDMEKVAGKSLDFCEEVK